MKMIDRLSLWLSRLFKRDAHPACLCLSTKREPAVASEMAGSPWKLCVTIVQEAWLDAMVQRSCVDMPLLIDSVPDEVLRISLTESREVRHD